MQIAGPDAAAIEGANKNTPETSSPQDPVDTCSERCKVSIGAVHDEKLMTFLKNRNILITIASRF